jgi:hypothetical protein
MPRAQKNLLTTGKEKEEEEEEETNNRLTECDQPPEAGHP